MTLPGDCNHQNKIFICYYLRMFHSQCSQKYDNEHSIYMYWPKNSLSIVTKVFRLKAQKLMILLTIYFV